MDVGSPVPRSAGGNLRDSHSVPTRVRALALVVAIIAIPAAGCVKAGGSISQTSTHGYVVPELAVEQVPPGSSKDQVLIALGSPSTTGHYGSEVYLLHQPDAEAVRRLHAVQGRRPERARRLFRQEREGRAHRQLRPQGRQGLRLHQRHDADRRPRRELPPAGAGRRRRASAPIRSGTRRAPPHRAPSGTPRALPSWPQRGQRSATRARNPTIAASRTSGSRRRLPGA